MRKIAFECLEGKVDLFDKFFLLRDESNRKTKLLEIDEKYQSTFEQFVLLQKLLQVAPESQSLLSLEKYHTDFFSGFMSKQNETLIGMFIDEAIQLLFNDCTV